MTTVEMLAVAVLKGDQTAARALFDALADEYVSGAREVLPVHKLTVSRNRIRVAIFVDDESPLSVEQLQSIRNGVSKWLDGGEWSTVVLQSIDRIEVYELPDSEKVTS